MDLALVFQFYWGGRINETGGSFAYEPPRCKKAVLMKHRISYDELVDIAYTYMQLDPREGHINRRFKDGRSKSMFCNNSFLDKFP